MLWSFLKRCTNLFDGQAKRVVHFAPEPFLSRRLREELGQNYLTADLNSATAMFRADLTDLPFRDGVFDVVICSHVLEHIPDDRKAMAEMRRVLRPGGWAAILVPILYPDATDEDLTITDPAEQLRRFLHNGHVRGYGQTDFMERLRSQAFKVDVVRRTDFLTEDECRNTGVTDISGDVFFCSPS
jgi:SAM-dependent methyltransferase